MAVGKKPILTGGPARPAAMATGVTLSGPATCRVRPSGETIIGPVPPLIRIGRPGVPEATLNGRTVRPQATNKVLLSGVMAMSGEPAPRNTRIGALGVPVATLTWVMVPSNATTNRVRPSGVTASWQGSLPTRIGGPRPARSDADRSHGVAVLAPEPAASPVGHVQSPAIRRDRQGIGTLPGLNHSGPGHDRPCRDGHLDHGHRQHDHGDDPGRPPVPPTLLNAHGTHHGTPQPGRQHAGRRTASLACAPRARRSVSASSEAVQAQAGHR